MGSPMTEERHLYAALNNCAFVSTAGMHTGRDGPPSRPFTFLMDASMLGYAQCVCHAGIKRECV
jgi:ribonucleoside-triphosphate reductase (thioredoxin)